uniref:regulator of microtubule dynamics protein 1-like n=1 Tax=Styela clava TaxID=7725 RepID=UPI00193A5849|nr:regulator of microtubule dynamics protein 1-like [Styela clava]
MNSRSILSRRLFSFCRRFSNQVTASQSAIFKICPRKAAILSIFSGSGILLWTKRMRNLKAKEVDDKSIIVEADNLYSTGDEPRHLYNYLIKYKDSTNAEILWRVSRASRDLALNGSDVSKEDKKALVYDAFETAKRALEIDETNWGSHKWFAITLGDVGDYEGTKIKISNAYVIKDHLERALQLNPKDATTAHCIGLWCLAFAELPWYQQKIASVLFGTPPTSTFEEAIKMFELAEKTEPNFYSVNLVELGRCYMMIGDNRHALLYLDKASKYPATNDEDRQAVERAKKLLEELIAKNKK